MPQQWRIAGINFDHFHMGDLLREVFDLPNAEIVGIADEQPARMQEATANFGLSAEQVFTDASACLDTTQPDVVILCPAAAEHAEWTERVAPHGVHILMEKPFAASLADADRMIQAMASTGKQLAINWPMRWYPTNITAKRLVDEGAIGQVQEVHYYDGNRGPLYHTADKRETEPTTEDKAASWFYDPERGGGSLLDYLGYGVTLATWFNGGQAPIEVTCMSGGAEGLAVDEQSVSIVRYATGLSTFQTRWGTFTDPWTAQPQPKCGFVIKGSAGTVSAYDFESTVRLQTLDAPDGCDVPVDSIEAPGRSAVEYVLNCLDHETPVEGPLSPAMCRLGQGIVDTAYDSAQQKRTLPVIS